jgi:hypothetical protein
MPYGTSGSESGFYRMIIGTKNAEYEEEEADKTQTEHRKRC